MKKDRELIRDARKTIEREKRKVLKKGGKTRQEMSEPATPAVLPAPDNPLQELENLKKQIKAMTPEELCDWLIEVHETYVQYVNYTVSQDFLNGTEYMERYNIITYMLQLINLLALVDIKHLPEETVQCLYRKHNPELLAILNVLNYI